MSFCNIKTDVRITRKHDKDGFHGDGDAEGIVVRSSRLVAPVFVYFDFPTEKPVSGSDPNCTSTQIEFSYKIHKRGQNEGIEINCHLFKGGRKFVLFNLPRKFLPKGCVTLPEEFLSDYENIRHHKILSIIDDADYEEMEADLLQKQEENVAL